MNIFKPIVIALAALWTAGLAAAEAKGAPEDLELWANEGRWRHGKNFVEATPAEQFEKAKKLEEIGDVRQAADHFRRLADVYSESDQAEEALILAAKNYLAAGEYTDCRDQIIELRRRYVHPTYLDALGRVESSLARGYLEGKGEGGTFKLASRIRKARAIYKNLLSEDPEGRWADDALLGLGQCDEALAKYGDAIKNYKELLEKYPVSELRAEAEGRIAYCINMREPDPAYEETETVEAIKRIEIAREEARSANSALDMVALEENERLLKDRQAQKRFQQAQFYQVNGHWRAAEVYYERIKESYAESEWAKKADEELRKLRER